MVLNHLKKFSLKDAAVEFMIEYVNFIIYLLSSLALPKTLMATSDSVLLLSLIFWWDTMFFIVLFIFFNYRYVNKPAMTDYSHAESGLNGHIHLNKVGVCILIFMLFGGTVFH